MEHGVNTSSSAILFIPPSLEYIHLGLKAIIQSESQNHAKCPATKTQTSNA
jgi:hypothetical protein